VEGPPRIRPQIDYDRSGLDKPLSFGVMLSGTDIAQVGRAGPDNSFNPLVTAIGLSLSAGNPPGVLALVR